MHAREGATLGMFGRARDAHLPDGLEIEGHIMQDEMFDRAAVLPTKLQTRSLGSAHFRCLIGHHGYPVALECHPPVVLSADYAVTGPLVHLKQNVAT
jgi:hypothetical protein